MSSKFMQFNIIQYCVRHASIQPSKVSSLTYYGPLEEQISAGRALKRTLI